jgi:N-acetyl-anhydromuramyl-L-alanine amidase AmpD
VNVWVEFDQAENFTLATARKVNLFVLHCTDGPKVPGAARNVAAYFAGRAKNHRGELVPAPEASTHFVTDNVETIQCVRLQDVAWGARGANKNSVHLEIIGKASQTALEWDDAYARPMLSRAVLLTAAVCLKFALPPVLLRAEELKLGRDGITTHAEVTLAWRKSTHTDPGLGFPAARFVDRVAALMADPRFKLSGGGLEFW